MPVAEAQDRIDSAAFAEWMAYDRIEPFGPPRADIHAAIIAAAVVNAQGGRNGKAVSPSEFMPNFDPPPELEPETYVKFLAAQAKLETLRRQRDAARKQKT